jgi:DNA polymerase III subunit delta
MTDEKPVVYVVHGDDPIEMTRFVDAMVAKLAETGMAEMNLSRLDGRTVSESDLRTAALSLPFLADRRLVVVDQAQTRFAKGSEERLKPFLDGIPPTTALVLLVYDTFEAGGARRGWQSMPANHWLAKWIESAHGRCHYKVCRLPDQEDMPFWIRKKAEALGGKFNTAAAITLADHTGNDTRYAQQEITKLLTYVDGARAVEPADVELLTAPGGQVNVFDMVDALGEGSADRALRLLRGLLDETDTYSLFGMMVRQFRLLVQTREVLDEGGSVDTLAHELSVPSFVARKLAGQAGRFSLARLCQVYHRLLELDEGTKLSQWSPELALELFVAEMKR